jgi:hypothetical protein
MQFLLTLVRILPEGSRKSSLLMHRKTFLHMLLIMMCLTFGIKKPVHAQNEKFKALFIYNFTKHILWPDDYGEGDFVIGILGTSPVVNELNIIASKKSVNGQNIVIERYTSVKQITRCHMLYIPAYNSSKLAAVAEQCKDKPVVIITDEFKTNASAASINFIMKEGYLDFEIYKDNILNKGLKVNPKLFSLGNEK